MRGGPWSRTGDRPTALLEVGRGYANTSPPRVTKVTGRQSAPRGGRPPVLDLALRSTHGAFQAPIQTGRLVCSTRTPRLNWGFVAHPEGFEPATIGLEVRWLRTVAYHYVPFRVTPTDPPCSLRPCDAACCRVSTELKSTNGAHTGPWWRPMAPREAFADRSFVGTISSAVPT